MTALRTSLRRRDALARMAPGILITLEVRSTTASPAERSPAEPQPTPLAQLGHGTLPPPATTPSSSPLAGELVLLVVAVLGLIGLTLWTLPRRPGPKRGAAPDSSLLPPPRWGATPHERLQDAKYLSGILEAELSDTEPSPINGPGELAATTGNGSTPEPTDAPQPESETRPTSPSLAGGQPSPRQADRP